jgi:putative iron-dependent peroxidase
MSKPQSVILPEPAESALFLVLEVDGRKRNARAVAEAAAAIPELTRRLATRPRSHLVSAIAFGRRQWDAISPERRPKGFRPFRAIGKGRRRAPATGGDLLLHAVSREADLCFELAFALRRALGDRAAVMDEVHGFRYQDSRDLTGFIDGTENPKGRERAEAALVGDEDPDFAGGSFVFTQRYVHDLAKWEALPTDYQEGVIGRTKQESRELPDDVKPDTAHIARVVIEEDGRELEILRHSMPYGTTSEHGLFFIAYTKDLAIPTRMLERMQGVSGDGRRDALLAYTRAVSGAHFFAPSLATLASL